MNYLAQNLDAIQQEGLPDFVGGDKLGDVINNTKLITWIFFASGFLLLIYLLLGGLQLMTSRGDPKAVAGAWAKITNAVIGFVVIFLAYFLTSIFGEVFGLSGFGGIFN